MSTKELVKGGSFLLEPALNHAIFTREQITEEMQMLGEMATDFVESQVVPKLHDLEKKENICPLNIELMKKAGELGLLGIDVPEEYEGAAMGINASMYAAECTAPAASFAVSLMAHNGIGILPLAFFGSKELKDKYLKKMATGELLAAYCLTEPSFGSDALNAKSTAVRNADGTWTINGGKMWITNGGFADIFTIYAKVDGEKFTAFLIETGTPGFTIAKEEDKMGLKGSSTREIAFDNVIIPGENLLGEIGEGHKSALGILDIGRLKLGMGCIGSSKAAIAYAAKYANERKQFSQPISNFGMIRRKFAEMSVKVFDLESIGYRTSNYVEESMHTLPPDDHTAEWHNKVFKAIEEYSIECSILKVFGSEVQAFVADTALQVYGGYGFSEEYPLARMYRDERVFRIFEGTNEINRMITVGTILKRAMKGEMDFMGGLNKVLAEVKEGIDKSFAEGPIGREITAANLAKKLAVYTAGCVIQKHMANLADKNYLMGPFEYPMEDLANMIMDVYVMDSNVARTTQFIAENGADKASYFITLTQISTYEKLHSLFGTAYRLLSDVAGGDAEGFGKYAKALERLTFNYTFDLAAAKEKVAAKVIAGEKYNPFV